MDYWIAGLIRHPAGWHGSWFFQALKIRHLCDYAMFLIYLFELINHRPQINFSKYMTLVLDEVRMRMVQSWSWWNQRVSRDCCPHGICEKCVKILLSENGKSMHEFLDSLCVPIIVIESGWNPEGKQICQGTAWQRTFRNRGHNCSYL